MRILIVTPWFPTKESPASGRFVEREAAALGSAHEVHVLHLDWQHSSGPAEVDGPYRLVHVALRRLNPFDYVRARRLVSVHAPDFDVVHTHALTGLLPWGRRRPTPGPWVHSEHWSGITAPETLSMPERMTRRALLPLLAGPDVVISESTRLADAVRAHRTGPTMIVPCIVPAVRIVEPPGGDTIRLVGVGGLIPRKGPLLAVQALAHLVSLGYESRLTWVGEGPQRDEVVSVAAENGVADRVVLTGVLDDEGVAAALDAADVFVLPTQGDNFCVVAAEALSHGRPIVSGVATGAVDYAEPRVSVFVGEQNGQAYAEAVLSVRERTRGLRASDIADTVADRFTPTAVRAGIEAAYAAAGVPAVS